MSVKDHESEPKQPEESVREAEDVENEENEEEDVASSSDETTSSDEETRAQTDTTADYTHTTGMPEMAPPLLVVCFVVCIFVSSMVSYQLGYQRRMQQIEAAQEEELIPDEEPITSTQNTDVPVVIPEHEVNLPPAEVMPDMQELYAKNNDFIGWLKIDDTNIDYPVMQSMYDEEYYLNRDFNKNYSMNGCLIMDTDSQVGTGTAANDYKDGSEPCTNLIIHGHNMRNGDMFGNLDKYRDEEYCKSHNIIRFSTLYEDREYEVVSVFLSQVFLKTQTDVFKYYKFFQANTTDDFNYFYDNIKDMALYDTGVTAEFGDEFITLSVCAYHVENGRLVVVGKRIK